MVQNWPREHHLVTKGAVELLILEKSVSGQFYKTVTGKVWVVARIKMKIPYYILCKQQRLNSAYAHFIQKALSSTN